MQDCKSFDEDSCELEEVAPGHLFVQIDGLRSSQGVNIQAELGQDIGNLPNFIEPPNAPNSGRDLTFIFIGLIAIAATLFRRGYICLGVETSWERQSKDRKRC